MSRNVFLFSLIAHKQKIVAQYTTVPGGNVEEFAARILSVTTPKKNPWAAFNDAGHTFQIFVDQDFMVYMCLTPQEAREQLRKNYLEDLRTKWRAFISRPGTKDVSQMGAYEMSGQFENQFKALFSTYNTERADKIAKIKENLQEAQDVTTQNLKMALARGDQLRVMSEKADAIKQSAQAFRREANSVKWKMLWQRIRCYVIAAIIIIILIIAIAMFACGGPTFAKCKEVIEDAKGEDSGAEAKPAE